MIFDTRECGVVCALVRACQRVVIVFESRYYRPIGFDDCVCGKYMWFSVCLCDTREFMCVSCVRSCSRMSA